MKHVEVAFGVLASPLHEQLGLPRHGLRHFQRCADAVLVLSVGGFLSESDVHRARVRIMKEIAKTFGQELAARRQRQ